jgi:hypothetical protein
LTGEFAVPPQTVLFIHGYSETCLSAYHAFPRLISEAGLNVRSIYLSAFDSLDDQISIDDLAAGLADRIAGEDCMIAFIDAAKLNDPTNPL